MTSSLNVSYECLHNQMCDLLKQMLQYLTLILTVEPGIVWALENSSTCIEDLCTICV